jgi:hypothetical protein
MQNLEWLKTQKRANPSLNDFHAVGMDAPISEKPFLHVQKPAKTCKNLQRDRRQHE